MIKIFKIRSGLKFDLMDSMSDYRELSKTRHLLVSNKIDYEYIDILYNNPNIDHYTLFSIEIEEVELEDIVCPKERAAIFKYLIEN